LSRGGSDVQLIGDLMADECIHLFAEWQANPSKQAY